ncbi:hypothetical protein [Wolbachia endosymbiont (group A) of Apoderus coryli]|uniref:hypothetical protein n=1 Tax=Wolbachia endosymbiont (group A) of Apoderus coryli TaxID=2953980 RepID=UPI00222F4392|nr:hypothetical protein [Wolbachia endosymbiont (group A) of Apoderus coryli]
MTAVLRHTAADRHTAAVSQPLIRSGMTSYYTAANRHTAAVSHPLTSSGMTVVRVSSQCLDT